MKIYTKTQEILSDTLTPISAFLSLRDVFANVSLFESSDYNSRENSRSYICVKPIVTVQVQNKILDVKINGHSTLEKFDVVAEDVEHSLGQFHFVNLEQAPCNCFFGVIGYDAVPLFEDIEFKRQKDDLPEVFLAAYQFVLEFDHFHNRLKMRFNSFSEEENELFVIMNALNQTIKPTGFFENVGCFQSSETDESFKEKVTLAKEHVARGDVFQLVLSRQFKQKFKGDDFEVYRQLRTVNPSPYMFYFDMNRARLIGASPEAQLRVSGNRAEIHPIAGTVKRTADEQFNLQKIEQLRTDEKENAEHMMLVDLARNDLNRSCSHVQVERLKEVQTFSHVIHLVSKVTGKVTSDSTLQTFGTSFPAGTLSGAPKYRAMELIDKYEATNRRYYGGAIGMISTNGDINMAIVIRSALSYKNELIYQAGAGIVLDSTEEGECQEVYNKVGSVQQAIQNANQQ
ncbi:MAG: anthranilate synthase component I family protein [Crocinitomicaceae bacterium]|nr:anthranilate synthase component I family protein [Crocinitomicaceae bacterium]